MRTEKATKTITQSGDSLVINVTKEVKRLGLGRGDDVDITLSSAMGDDLAFITMAMANALNGWIDDIEIDGNGYFHGLTPDQVNRIYVAVSTVAPGALIMGMDPTHDDYITIDAFNYDNVQLLEWRFIIDHD